MKAYDAEERQKAIIDYTDQHAFADVAMLSQLLGVTEMTIRRDLNKLEEEQQLVRVHGGARSVPKEMREEPLRRRLTANYEEKDRIGRLAASLVQDGDIIAMDASSTVYAMARHLTANVTVVTNNLTIAMELHKNKHVEVILLGGTMRKLSASTVGYETMRQMANYHVDKAFVSSKAIDIENGVTDATAQEGEVKRAMIASAQTAYFLMDHSKLGSFAFYQVCGMEEVLHLVTDEPPGLDQVGTQFIDVCRQRQVDLQIAK